MRSLAAAVVLLSLPALVAAEAGSTGGSTLGRPIGSRGLAMGEAFAAVEGGLDSLGYNPAGVARLERPQIQLQYTHGIVDDHFTSATYGHKLPFGAIWGGMTYYDAGSVTLNFADGTSARVTAQQDFVATGGAAFKLGEALSLGAQARVYRFNLAERATASGFATDYGAHARLPIEGLSVGAALRNVGPNVKYEQDGDPLPLEARAGAAYLLDLYKLDLVRSDDYTMHQFLFTVDAVKPRDTEAWVGIGLEMRMPLGPEGQAAVRMGYKANQPFDAPTIGLGLREKRMTIDYAFSGRRQVSSVHHFTLGWLF